MKHVRTFESFRNNKAVEPVNEALFGGLGNLLKGALGKVMAAFSGPFKDFAEDFKKAFKPDDPDSIKGIIMANLKEAIDKASKGLYQNDETTKKPIDETGVMGVLDRMVDFLIGLSTGIDKDIDTAVGKDKSAGAKAVAKAIILGSKEAQWVGIVGLIDWEKGVTKKETNYKFSKKNFLLKLANTKGNLSVKKKTATDFLKSLKEDIEKQLDKEFTDEEVQKVYDESMARAKQGGGESSITFDQYQEFFDKKSPIIYLLKDKTKEDWDKLSDDQKSKPSEKPASDIVGVKVVDELNKSNTNLIDAWIVRFIGKDGKKITKFPKEIIGASETTESEDAKKAADSLGKIKADPEKMKKVAMFSDFLQDDKNKDKIAGIVKIITPEGGGE